MKRPPRIRPLWINAIAVFSLCATSFAQTPLTLFNGSSLLGWNNQGTWTASGGVLGTSGEGARHVLTAMPFEDLDLQFEYNESSLVDAKLRLWANHEDNGGLLIDLDNSGASSGVGGVETLAHSSIASVSQGWHRIQVEASHGQLKIKLDGQPVSSASGLGNRAGYIAFEAGGSGALQVRNIKLTPLSLNGVFSGVDLTGWKSIARGPNAKASTSHTLQKAFSFGIAGGTTKAHEANWTVQSGAIHGQDGPGGLENGNTVEDAIVHISAVVKGVVKPENFTSIALRNVPGQLQGGYPIGIGLYTGSIDQLVKHAPLPANGSVDETIVIAGRTIAIWNGTTLATVYTDTRAESANTGQGAKTSSGSMTILLPNSSEQVDIRRVAVAALSKNYGVAAHAPPPPPPTALSTQAQTAPQASIAETAFLQQQQATAKRDADDKASKQRTAGLMRQALSTTDPQQQMDYYSQVVQIDPSNAAAVQGYKEAQAKVEAQQTAQQQQTTNEIHQQQDQQTRDQQTTNALVQAQGEFLGGHLSQAGTALSTAERLSPNNPMVRDLRSRISSAQSLRSRLYWFGGGLGIAGCISLFALWFHRRRQQRYAMLEIVRGLDTGRTYSLDRDMIRIGAVSQDGGQKNDIVIQDVEHAISRFHCEVARKNGNLYVTDLKSSNGTRLNGETLKPGSPTLLRKGSKITLADSVDLRLGYQRRMKKG